MKKIIALMFAMIVSIMTFSSYSITENDNDPTHKFSEAEILKLCKWFVSTPPSDDAKQAELRKAAGAQILLYAVNTETFTLDITNASTQLFGKEKNSVSTDLFSTYLAGEVLYCLEHNLKKNNATSFSNAMEGVINIYSQMANQPIKSLNKYLKMDKEKRMMAFEKLYNNSNRTVHRKI